MALPAPRGRRLASGSSFSIGNRGVVWAASPGGPLGASIRFQGRARSVHSRIRPTTSSPPSPATRASTWIPCRGSAVATDTFALFSRSDPSKALRCDFSGSSTTCNRLIMGRQLRRRADESAIQRAGDVAVARFGRCGADARAATSSPDRSRLPGFEASRVALEVGAAGTRDRPAVTLDEAFQVLGLELTANREAVQRAYLRLLRRHNPERDRAG